MDTDKIDPGAVVTAERLLEASIESVRADEPAKARICLSIAETLFRDAQDYSSAKIAHSWNDTLRSVIPFDRQ